ncbi:MAG: PEP-CTERM sorting domain-containing protein [Thermoguttaceae bacterium]|jgi:hypothetical protein|nr:PEP-CTERM sorting domain-containing protein [Thermoguttaceae bacterium]
MKLQDIPALRVLAAIVLGGVIVAPSAAALIVADNFSRTDRTDAAGYQAAWFTARSDGTRLTIVEDSSGIGDGNALRYDSAGFNAIVAPWTTAPGKDYGRIDLDIPGNAVTLRFDFRMDADTSLQNQGNGFRFGILNNNGTQPTADNQGSAHSANTFGYGVGFGVGGSASSTFLRDTYPDAGVLSGAGLQTFGGFTAGVSGQDPHEAVLKITRKGTGVLLETSVRNLSTGTLVGSGSSLQTNDIVTAFHHLGFVSTHNDNNFLLDNVSLDYNVLANGTFERDVTLSGWSASALTADHAGLFPYSNKALLIKNQTSAGTRGSVAQSVADPWPHFTFEVDFAAENPGNERTMNLFLENAHSGQINLRLVNSGGAGLFQVYDTAWRSLTDLGSVDFSTFIDDVGDDLNLYRLRITGRDYGTSDARYDMQLFSYDINGNLSLVGAMEDITYWQNAAPVTAAHAGLQRIHFSTQYANTTAGKLLIDNVSLVYIPEPNALLLLATAGGFLSMCRRRRRRR